MPLSSNTTVKDLFLSACKKNDIITVKRIQWLLPDVNWRDESNSGWTGLHYAANCNYGRLLDLLLGQPGVDVNIFTNGNKLTPLMVACSKGHKNIVRTLSRAPGIDLNLKSCYGNTALHYAVSYRHPRCLEVLRRSVLLREICVVDWNVRNVVNKKDHAPYVVKPIEGTSNNQKVCK